MEPTTLRLLVVLTSAAAALGCGGNGGGSTGDARLFLEAEGTITDGLAPGTEEDDIVDGWSVSYAQFVVSIGDVHLGRASTGEEAREPQLVVIDLASLPASGHALASFDDLAAVRWDLLSFVTSAATADAVRDPSVSQADFDTMVAGACTYLIAGTISSPTGTSCPPGGTCTASPEVDFTLCVPATTTFSTCTSPDGMPGLAVPAGGTTTGAITIHGDHLWFNAFPSGGEGTIERRAQWLADSDLDQDGVVTEAELRSVDASAVFTSTLHYSLAGSPLPIDHAWDWVVAQVATQGHFQGEGECVYTLAR